MLFTCHTLSLEILPSLSLATRQSRSLEPTTSEKGNTTYNTGGWGVVNTVDPRLCSRVSVEYVKFLIPEVHP